MVKDASVKQSIYLQTDLLEEINAECARLDRSRAWIILRCVRLGIGRVHTMPPDKLASESEDDAPQPGMFVERKGNSNDKASDVRTTETHPGDAHAL